MKNTTEIEDKIKARDIEIELEPYFDNFRKFVCDQKSNICEVLYEEKLKSLQDQFSDYFEKIPKSLDNTKLEHARYFINKFNNLPEIKYFQDVLTPITKIINGFLRNVCSIFRTSTRSEVYISYPVYKDGKSFEKFAIEMINPHEIIVNRSHPVALKSNGFFEDLKKSTVIHADRSEHTYYSIYCDLEYLPLYMSFRNSNRSSYLFFMVCNIIEKLNELVSSDEFKETSDYKKIIIHIEDLDFSQEKYRSEFLEMFNDISQIKDLNVKTKDFTFNNLYLDWKGIDAIIFYPDRKLNDLIKV